MTPPERERPTIEEIQDVIHRAWESLRESWNAIDYAQRQMRLAGVPDLIVDHLEGARLACVAGKEWREVVEAVDQIAQLGEAKP